MMLGVVVVVGMVIVIVMVTGGGGGWHHQWWAVGYVVRGCLPVVVSLWSTAMLWHHR